MDRSGVILEDIFQTTGPQSAWVVIIKTDSAWETPGRRAKTDFWASSPVSDFVGEPENLHCSQVPADADVSCPGNTLWEPLAYHTND